MVGKKLKISWQKTIQFLSSYDIILFLWRHSLSSPEVNHIPLPSTVLFFPNCSHYPTTSITFRNLGWEQPAQWSAQTRCIKCRAKKRYFQKHPDWLKFLLVPLQHNQNFCFCFLFWGVWEGDRSVMKFQRGLQQPWVILIPCNVFFKGKVFKTLFLPGFLSPSPCFVPKVWLHDELPDGVIKMCQLPKVPKYAIKTSLFSDL